MSQPKLTDEMVNYIRSGPLYHRSPCELYSRPSPMSAALAGSGQEGARTYRCTCGLEALRMLIGRSY